MEDRGSRFFERLIQIIAALGTVVALYVGLLALSREELRHQLGPFRSTNTPVIFEVPVTVLITTTPAPPPAPILITSPPEVVEVPVTVISFVDRVVTATPEIPTTQPTPIMALPYEEDFSDGLSSEWDTIAGEWLWQDGKIFALGAGWNWLKIGEDTWKNYAIEVEANNQRRGVMGTEFVIGVRMSRNNSGFPAFRCQGGSGCWWAIYSTADIVRPLTDLENGAFSLANHIRIEVRDNLYTAYVNNQIYQSISLQDYSEGAILLGTRGERWWSIDNVQIVELNN